jgi:2-hydroxychromene-2-carboxylate isomerase
VANSQSTSTAVTSPNPPNTLPPPTPLTNNPQVSPYSWFGFTNTLKFRPLLAAHNIEVDILPFFLGGARDAAGNPFAPTPQWKQAFSSQDSDLTGKLLGLKVVAPEVFPISSLFVSSACPKFVVGLLELMGRTK